MNESLSAFLRFAVDSGASDVHLSVGEFPVIRVHGDLVRAGDEILTEHHLHHYLDGTLSEGQVERLQAQRELDFVVEIEGIGRFRGNVYFSRNGTGLVFRCIPLQIPTLKSLGHSLEIARLADFEHGLVLLTGATGSGKTTTLASILALALATHPWMIVSVEDPIEYVYPTGRGVIKQREVGFDTLSFHEGVKRALRQDPDILVVGELRDLPTIQAALTAAETGHLVFGTLHTTDAARTIDRIVDVFPSEQQNQILVQLANSLRAVLSQRLLLNAEGTGRVLASEFMRVNDAVRSCIRDRRSPQIPTLIELGRGQGMYSMDDSIVALFESGRITQEMAKSQLRDPDRLRSAHRFGSKHPRHSAARSSAGVKHGTSRWTALSKKIRRTLLGGL